MAEGTVATQFEALVPAAEKCDVIVAASALQVAARSVAEKMGIRYVFAAYTPVVLPSRHHAPPPLPPVAGEAAPPTNDNRELWARNAARFNGLFLDAVNRGRESLGLAKIADLQAHMTSDEPWLAADPVLAPWPDAKESRVVQTGAWILSDKRPLPAEVERFLQQGDAPIYFGFGSTRVPQDTAPAIRDAVRALGRRLIVSQGWSQDPLIENAPECLTVAEVNLQALFPRVAAVVHHGGAGTTTAAALAGVPQLVIPHLYDQHYWADRVRALAIGSAHAASAITADALSPALAQCLQLEVANNARALSASVRRNGTEVAAERLAALVGRSS
jgi:vancomycin aglycone glucosyltransferase